MNKSGLHLFFSWLVAACLVAVALFAAAGAAHAFPATQCPADRKGSDLGCTANDVSITGMSVVGDTTSCVGGAIITLDLQMTVNFAVPDRWDVGVFISNDGKSPQTRAVNGGAASCAVSVLPNSSPFLDLDGGATGDTCGDGNKDIGGGTGSGIHFMPQVTVPCQSLAGASGNLYIPFVVSWDNQKTPPGAVCTSNTDPVPNTVSKCNAPTVVQGSVAVVVLPTIAKTDGKATIFSGDSTNYDVTITNTTGAPLSGVVFKDPAVSGIAVSSLSCAAAGGATCPASSTVAAMQGAGITIPAMPVGSSVIFTIGATLTGSPNDTRTNTATVTAGSQTNTASDTNTIVDTIAILPTTQSKTGDSGATLTYTYTLHNFGLSADNITLSAVSSKGWTVGVSPTPVAVAAGGSTTVTLTVTIPPGAAVGDVDSTMITATSGNNPSKTATAMAVTTVTTVLTLTPSNTGGGGAGASVYYTHWVQSNASASKQVSLTPSFTSGSCVGWTSALFESNKTTVLTSPVTLDPNGGYKDFVLKVSIPVGAVASSTCTATLTAAYTVGAPSTVSVTDVTTVKNLVLYEDPGYTTENYVYPAGNNVYAKGYGLNTLKSYEYRWYNSSGVEACTPRATSTTGTTFPDTCLIPAGGPLGTWTAQIWNTTDNVLFVQSNFYVGPDHLKANYSGVNPAINTNAVVNLALHDKTNHVVPFDPSGNLVKGNPADPEGPLMITVTVGGSATIISTTLANAVITGQSVTGKLDSITGTATLSISDSVAETVTITPVSYKGVLYGSPARDEPAMVTFTGSGLYDHLEIQHGSGTGVTCTPSTLTIKACADALAPCTPYTAGVSGTLSATGAGITVNWAGGSGAFTIAAGSSTATKDVQVTTVGSVVFDATSIPAAATATTCNFGAPSCMFTVADAGFIVTAPGHVAETASTLTIQAVKSAPGNPLLCAPGLTGAKTVNLKCSYTDPASGTLPVRVGGTALNAANNAAAACDAGGRNVSLTFDATGVATPALQYADVGNMLINASFTGAVGSIDEGLNMTGSGSFIAAPASFAFSAITAGLIKAGNSFSATVTALNASGAVTPNFGNEAAAEGVTLAPNLVSPVGGNNPGIANNIVPGGAFANGAATVNNLSWGEVGLITMTASLTSGNYLGSALTASGTSANIGRFIPDHFDTVTSGGMPCPSGLTCPTQFNGFVYSGQAFTAQVTARNLAGATTLNYDSALGYSKAVALSAWDAAGGATPTPGGGTLNPNAVPSTAFNLGVATTGTPAYTFPTTPVAPTDIYIRAVDTDGATSLRASSVEGGMKIVSGRAKISNANGSELLPLTMTATVQYYNAAGSWVTSTTDSVTSLTLGLSNYQRKTGGAWTTTPTPASGSTTGGVLSFTLSKPTGGGTGSVDVGISAPAYLLTGSNIAGTNPSTAGRATFGVYRGSNDFIYRRESY